MQTRYLSCKSRNRNKRITRNETCSNLFHSNELDFFCDNYKPMVDALSYSRGEIKKVLKINILETDAASLGQLRVSLTHLRHCIT